MASAKDRIFTDASYHRWKPAAWLRVTGEDAFNFLQGQFSNDLSLLDAHREAVYGLWLNHKGRVLGDAFILRTEQDGFWICSYFCGAEELRSRLESFIIADDVTVEDHTSEVAAVTLLAPRTLPRMGTSGSAGNLWCFSGRRRTASHVEWVYPLSAAAEIDQHLADAAQVDESEMEFRRIQDGIPAIPKDLGPGDLPNEGGLETVALSYTKGCYVGQEVMARLRSMGQVRRRLRRVRGAGAPPSLPMPVVQAGRQVGELRSAAVRSGEFVGLAMLSNLNVQAGAPLSLATEPASMLTLDTP